MEKSSPIGKKRASRIKELLAREDLNQCDLAGMIFTRSRKKGSNGELVPMDPQNFSRSLVRGKVSDNLCREIKKLFPRYNVSWLLGDSDLMLMEDVRQDFIARTQETNNASMILLETALREVCSREGMEIPTLDNITELLFLQAQLRDYADSLMWNYVKHRKHSHVWSYLDREEVELVENNRANSDVI